MTVIWNGYHVHLVEEIAVNQEVRYAFTLVCRVFNVFSFHVIKQVEVMDIPGITAHFLPWRKSRSK